MNISKTLQGQRQKVTAGINGLCDVVKQMEDRGEYTEAARYMGEWWEGVGVRPDVGDLPVGEKAAILSRVGALSGWLGSMRQVPGSQEKAKDLISEGATLFGAINDLRNWAETRSDLAVCYWREGAFDEARVVLQDVLANSSVFSAELCGKILLRLVGVEITTRHFQTASALISQATSIIGNNGNPLLLGKLYFYKAFTLRTQGEDQNKPDLLLSAVGDYQKAESYYKKAKHNLYAANVETNLGNLFRVLEDFDKAHLHLDKAIHLYVKYSDQSRAGSVYETKARTLIAQNNLPDAEFAALSSVSMLRDGGENATLSESLVTLGVVLSRGGKLDQAIDSFLEAKEVALGVGDNESAGNAVLTQIEELQAELTPIVFRSLYLEADELLRNSPKINTINRLQKIARKQFEIGVIDSDSSPADPAPSWENFSLSEAVRIYEREIIQKALSETGGRVTKAAILLGLSHQNLSLILRQRHSQLKAFCAPRKPRSSERRLEA